ncbi:MAG: 2-oxoglutarate ferredoxin oxidoreductase subunit beta [Chloroflexi bacterium GWB2_49_20]|nr:MAG: 2-oxoglutarate ferredoxin oxidoreductase subunit beta [Chloroflexi bacterium GWB2_49_20]OGN80022.1 MAG: 2-oxoglutarate ferredoxin oxidoreductase subunit beta [Chloroflexi bacterium GWC2_49_37]OGN85442.1 MAG: 2-oxoglutarate ferredoxin oxidoreductase subunit beta [Chloroflexi bacterium GWD2_49_16]HBG74306.1 2-oxoglutarate ferredoxin oxidoreductase subunit beta [Anaerolineae bacterium]HCM97084.1 2-oxoglutarate ferredoxin oxidoreductase subunit beta [Anaerolineae bacterium]
MAIPVTNTNQIGLQKNDYKGLPSTLCQGCGHNSISNQIITACYELGLVPEEILKFSGIGCSSKSPAYFLERSFGFNSLHGRMAPLATGAVFADTSLKALGVSGDGDTASIGMSGFKHMLRRNTPMVYIVENNGVYGLTKGQFSATAEVGLSLKHQGTNPYMPVDICMEAIISNATFVGRSFAGDPKQVKELIKAALNHRGVAVLDIISPCVTFNNQVNAFHSYTWGKDHEAPLHEISFVPKLDEIILADDFMPGTVTEVCLHDGSMIVLKKLEKDYDPTDRWQALHMLEESQRNNWLVTGLIYIECDTPTLTDRHNLPDTPLNRLTDKDLRPAPETLDQINSSML